MKIIFRADASLQIGTGHIMRCLVLAESLRERGASCHFVCRAHPGNLVDLIRQRGFAVHSLPYDSAWNVRDRAPHHAAWLGADWAKDVEQTRAALSNSIADWLIVDHYALDARWESALRTICRKIMAIDDMADRSHDCDLLLDQNIVGESEHRYDDLVSITCVKLLGPQYALLHKQYARLRPQTSLRQGDIRRVLVSFGGADATNVTGKVITAFLASSRRDVTLDVVINPNSPHTVPLRRQVSDHENILLCESLPTLAPLMNRADLAVGACGVTALERCCLGLPSLVVSLADNQRMIATELHRRGLVRWLGHVDEVDSTTIYRALTGLFESGNPDGWSERCFKQVDGMGADRVAAIMAPDAVTKLTARLAHSKDEEKVFQWANDAVVRNNSFNPYPITRSTHQAWFKNRIGKPESCRLFIVESEEGRPVGQVRLERTDEDWELHYSLDIRYRRRGIAVNLLKTALLAFSRDFPGARVYGRVKLENEASRRVFLKLGFVETKGMKEAIFTHTIE